MLFETGFARIGELMSGPQELERGTHGPDLLYAASMPSQMRDVDRDQPAYQANRAAWNALLEDFRLSAVKVREGGGVIGVQIGLSRTQNQK